MADGIDVTPGSGKTVATDEVTGITPTLSGSSQVQIIKIADGTVDGTNKLVVDSAGRITIALATGGGKTLQFGVINTATSGDNQLLAAPGAGLKIKIVSYALIAAGTVNVKFTSGIGGTNMTGPYSLIANTGIGLSGSTASHLLEAGTNTAFVLNLSGAIQVSGHYSYFVE